MRCFHIASSDFAFYSKFLEFLFTILLQDSANNSVMRQTSARHMDNLREVIQNITKSVNPLGKLMDFIPEDIDAMQLEFTLWRDTYTQAATELKREKRQVAGKSDDHLK